MKKTSDVTRKYKRLSLLFFTLSILVLAAPLLYYTIAAFIGGEVTEKVTMGMTFIVAGLLTAVNLVFKYNFRSALWILVLGIYYCLDNILPLLLMVAVGTILDEFILTPLHKNYAAKAKINGEIDQRI